MNKSDIIKSELLDQLSSHRTEVTHYFNFTKFTENTLNSSNSNLFNSNQERFDIDNMLINTMKSTLFLLLYNSVESVVNSILSSLSTLVITESKNRTINHFNICLKKLWCSKTLRLKDSLNSDKQLAEAIRILEYFEKPTELDDFISNTQAGNLDDVTINELLKKIGIILSIPHKLKKTLKCLEYSNNRQVYDKDDSCLREVRRKRNALAHGDMTFSDIGKDITIEKIDALINFIFGYLEAVIDSCIDHIENQKYLAESG